jgi:hypothetical protein
MNSKNKPLCIEGVLIAVLKFKKSQAARKREYGSQEFASTAAVTILLKCRYNSAGDILFPEVIASQGQIHYFDLHYAVGVFNTPYLDNPGFCMQQAF